MTELIAQAEQRLLRPGGLSAGDLERVFTRLMGPSIDAADLYFQHSRSESWVLEDGIVKDGNHSIEQGVGVRALSGEKAGFAYSDEIVLPALLEAAGSARAIAQAGANGIGKPLGKAIGSRYQVSGSWDKPQITLIAKENPRAKPGDAKPEGGELH